MSGHTKNNDAGEYAEIEGVVIDFDRQEEEIVVPKGKLSLVQGLGLVIGLQVGSGIFSSPNQIHIHAGSPGASLLVWCLSGFLAWSGAACYAELGCAIPANGGAQAYLARIYNDYVSFLFSWTTLILLKPGSASIISIVLAEYLSNGNGIVKRVIAIAAVLVVAGINLWGRGASAGIVFLVFKGVLLLGIFILGVVLATFRDHSEDYIWKGTHSIGDIIVALYGGIWAYDGWDNLNFLTAEMRNPTRDLSRVISISMPLVILTYCLINCSYFAALSSSDMDASTSVALTLAAKTKSKVAMAIVSGGIALSCAGALNACVVSMSKLVQVVAESGVLPRKLTEHKWAIILQALITICYCCVGEFKALIVFYGAAGYIFYLVTVVGLLVLRYKEPNLERPYRCWLVAPIVFIILSVTLICRTAYVHPYILLLVIGFIFVGLPLNLLAKRGS